MKKHTLTYLFIFFYSFIYSQNKNTTFDSNEFLKELSDQACLCIDSIPTRDLRTKIIASKINRCIDNVVGVYQLGLSLKNINLSDKDKSKQLNINLNTDKNSAEYKKNYATIEEYLMANCNALKETLAVNDVLREKSVSKNEEAMKAYHLGIAAAKKENNKEAIEHYKKAIAIDPEFAFAYDNMGLAYRKLEDYDNAFIAYQKSLEIDPNGTMPLQNIAVVYQYKKEYHKAIETYKKLAELDSKDPEIYYGIGNVYAFSLNDLENGLDNLCKAYNIYSDMKSPYRTDAQTLIQRIYANLKKEGKEDKFFEILKNNNINVNK
ncbi:tetratricopeptide repeat protein [Flavobacterium sufflavum]|uniref:Tetratricopeptide repeat protein n=1 Tax=Flavobacterium sufflavum TaxID=1921138 RepID=A0A437KPE9_9FLAO|nr:tetratricopeptide repeat protein [Flavobacterium sufflavum]RVT73372.1 tetratricopeptide repeat protein [Flavobacterium sufflavum]